MHDQIHCLTQQTKTRCTWKPDAGQQTAHASDKNAIKKQPDKAGKSQLKRPLAPHQLQLALEQTPIHGYVKQTTPLGRCLFRQLSRILNNADNAGTLSGQAALNQGPLGMQNSLRIRPMMIPQQA